MTIKEAVVDVLAEYNIDFYPLKSYQDIAERVVERLECNHDWIAKPEYSVSECSKCGELDAV